MTRPAAARVLVVDDHAIVRLGVRQLLGGGGFELFEAGSLDEARDLLAREAIDLVLLDLALGDDFGLAAIPRLRELRPGLRVLVLTSLDESLYAERALRAGADGYVMKTEIVPRLRQAVEAVLRGEVVLSPARRDEMLRRLAQPSAASGKPDLTSREVEVLRLVADGRSTREIALALNRSVKTIETHKQTLKAKLGAETPARLVRVALAWFDDRG